MRRLPNPYQEMARLQLELHERTEMDDAKECFAILLLCGLWFALGFAAALTWFQLGG